MKQTTPLVSELLSILRIVFKNKKS